MCCRIPPSPAEGSRGPRQLRGTLLGYVHQAPSCRKSVFATASGVLPNDDGSGGEAKAAEVRTLFLGRMPDGKASS